jgi:hypothetical protein
LLGANCNQNLKSAQQLNCNQEFASVISLIGKKCVAARTPADNNESIKNKRLVRKGNMRTRITQKKLAFNYTFLFFRIMKFVLRIDLLPAAICLSVWLGGHMVQANSVGIDPTNHFAWGENTGWANASSTGLSVTVHYDGSSGWLDGHVWNENVGWILMGSSGEGPFSNTASNNWGVNFDTSGSLFGYAWGENVGWICFPTNGYGGVSINKTNGEFSGLAWGENIGWLSLMGTSPDYGVRTIAFDRQPQSTPNWWLVANNVSENSDEGDDVPAWMEFVADTDPNNATSFFHLVSVTTTGTTATVEAWPTSTERYYTLKYTDSLHLGTWSNVMGQVNVAGEGEVQTLEDVGAGPLRHRFYTIKVNLAP